MALRDFFLSSTVYFYFFNWTILRKKTYFHALFFLIVSRNAGILINLPLRTLSRRCTVPSVIRAACISLMFYLCSCKHYPTKLFGSTSQWNKTLNMKTVLKNFTSFEKKNMFRYQIWISVTCIILLNWLNTIKFLFYAILKIYMGYL